MADWGAQQTVALNRVGRWLAERPKDKPVFQLAGYAGTGKTTLAKHLAAGVDGPVYFAAYTGKAAHVLTKSGAMNVSTIHKLIYNPKDKSQQRLKDLDAERAKLLTHKPIPNTLLIKIEADIRAERANLARPMFALNLESPLKTAKLVVVDEYSMIDKLMGTDLLSFGCPILALGDPGQLPPVRGEAWLTGQPDVLLTEIHRQARDNPIIWMSQEVREGRNLKPGDYGTSRVRAYRNVSRDELQACVLATDQLLVGRNSTRRSSNGRARELLGMKSPYPETGDKLVCLRNDSETGLLNGQIWKTVANALEDSEDKLTLSLESEEGNRIAVQAHRAYFHGKEPEYYERKDAQEFDYGYALTVHKSQGSQWNNVLLFDEWYMKDRRQWLYTAVTRAAQKLDLIQM